MSNTEKERELSLAELLRGLEADVPPAPPPTYEEKYGDLFFDKTSPLLAKHLPKRQESYFHYTSAEGFIGIVRDQNVWFSDTKFMNDGSERLWGLQLYKNIVDDLVSGEGNPKKKLFLQKMYATELSFSDPWRQVVFCMSEDGNLLNQWRDYGKHVVPYSIEIDINALVLAGANFNARVRQLIYSESVQKKLLRAAIDELMKIMSLGWELPDSEIETAAAYASFEISDILGSLKHPAFEPEREARLVVPHRRISDSGVRREYRTGPLGVVPYYRYRRNDGEKLPIKSVRVGPSPYAEASVAAAQMLLEDCGYKDVPVTPSHIPLRR